MIAAQARPHFRLDLDHAETLVRGLSYFSESPIRNLFFYAFPFLRAMFSSHVEIRPDDAAQAAMLPPGPKALMLREINDLARLARIQRKVAAFAALNHSFSSYGGLFSFTKPALFIPHHHLFRPGKSPFTQEQPQENLAGELWQYSDDETRFLLCREIAQIKHNNALLRIATKVCLLASVFVFYTMPFALLGAAALLAASIICFLRSERQCEAKKDIRGIVILGRRLNDPVRAAQIALATIEKQRRQNLARRQDNRLCRIYITPKGNNAVDLFHPYHTTREARIRRHFPH